MGDGLFNCRDPRRAAVVPWATFNGFLELMARPPRREMVGVERASLCQVALALFIQGLQTVPGGKEVRG